MRDTLNFNNNKLLASIPEHEYRRLEPHLQLIQVARNSILFEPQDPLQFLCFPTTCVISVVHTMKDSSTTEIAIVGNEGVVGVSVITDADTLPLQDIVLCGGYLLALPVEKLKREISVCWNLQRSLLRFFRAVAMQGVFTAACYRHHTIDQQFCRWLAMISDNSSFHELKITQSMIANMLGVSREGISVAAGKLQHADIITYSRGVIRIRDKQKLVECACECYHLIKDEYERLVRDYFTPSPPSG